MYRSAFLIKIFLAAVYFQGVYYGTAIRVTLPMFIMVFCTLEVMYYYWKYEVKVRS